MTLSSWPWTVNILNKCDAIDVKNKEKNKKTKLSYFFMQIFEMLHIHRYTPLPGLMLNAFPCLILVCIGQIDSMINAFGFVSWTFIGLVSAAVLILRRKMPNLSRPCKVRDILTQCLRGSKVF